MDLVSALATIYPDTGNQRRITQQLGIDSIVDLSGPPIVVWARILERARIRQQLGTLIALAMSEYGTNGDLVNAVNTELVRRPPEMGFGDEGNSHGSQALLLQMLSGLQSQIAALDERMGKIQSENVERRHQLANDLQKLTNQITSIHASEAGNVRRQGQIEDELRSLRQAVTQGNLARPESGLSGELMRSAWLISGAAVAATIVTSIVVGLLT